MCVDTDSGILVQQSI